MLKVLIVEDNPMVVTLFRVLVRKTDMNAETSEVHSVEKALVLLAGIKYDLIFLDHELPDGDGWEIAEMTSLEPEKFGKPKIIAMSGSASSADVDTRKKNFSRFIGKPFSIEEILPLIREAYEAKREISWEMHVA
ncbi:MAG: response regulator [Victivallales bacterium]